METNQMKGINRIELDSGLVLLTEKRPNTKKTALLSGVRVGSAHEDDRLNGGSHFNEHLLFKSNRHRSARQITEDLEYSGAVINAYTTWKYTAFSAKVPHKELPKAVEILFQAATNFSYNRDEFETERQVILTEIQNFINSPGRYSLTGLFIPKLFKGTPLERKVEGTVEAMGSVVKEELEGFKKKYYVPNNMVIAAVGRFDERKLVGCVEDLFGSLDAKNPPHPDPSIDLTNKRRERVEERRDISQDYMCLGYRVPGYTRDVHSLELISSILSEGLSSRMYRELREKRGIGYGVGSIFHPVGREGMFITHVDGFDPERREEAKKIILEIFRDLKENIIPEKEFKGTKNLVISKYDDQLEKITDRAMMLLETEIYDIPYDFREKEKFIRGISREEIRKTAEDYFTDEYSLTVLEPKESE
jgi:predicted Zn-dependent peptidase